MESPTSPENPAENPPAYDGEDRLSKLPDSILYHILSFTSVNIRDVVRMSILSRRWLNLWATLPHLFFDDELFAWRDDFDDDIEYNMGPFERFVDTVLLLRAKTDLKSFILDWSCKYELQRQLRLDVWLQHAVNRNVKVMSLIIDTDNNPLEWPYCIFTCRSLEELYLTYSQRLNVRSPKFVALTQLKILRLTNFITDDNCVERIISGCPVLEDLCLMECQINNSLDISSHTLINLGIGDCEIRGTIFRLSAPRLETFWFMGNSVYVPHILLESMPSLVDVRILTDNNQSGYKYAGSAIHLLKGLSSAKVLDIGSSSIGRIGVEDLSELPIFLKLESVTLGGWHMGDNFFPVRYFLRVSPNLESVIIGNEELRQLCRNNEEARQRLAAVRWHCPHLTVYFKVLCGNEDGFGDESKRAMEIVMKMFSCKCRQRISMVP